LQSVRHRGADDDGGAVLIVVEHRNCHPAFQALLDLEALGRLDVLEVDPAEGRLQRRHHVDEPVDILLGNFDVEHVDAGEFLEQHRLAFHDGLGGERADVAEPEHGGPVGDDGDEVLSGGQGGGFGRVGGDALAGGGDAGRVGERQVALIAERFRGLDLDFPGPRVAVVEERARAKLVRYVGHENTPPAPLLEIL
jgi:hypothetical protein